MKRRIFYLLLTIIFLFLLFDKNNTTVNASYSSSSFYYGVFGAAELSDYAPDANFINTINDLKAHNMNAILFTNNTPNLNISDNLGFNIVAAPMPDLYKSWYPTNIALDLTYARNLIYPIIDNLKNHPSVIGYNIRDDANWPLNDKFKMAIQVISERDSINPASPLLVVGGNVGRNVYSYINSKVFMGYRFPFRAGTAPCQVFSTPDNKDWILSERENLQLKPQSDPNWMVLQAHRTVSLADQNNASTGGLRQPSPEEISLQFWEALGEEAKGIFWFTYSDSGLAQTQTWDGLKNLTAQYGVASDLGNKLQTIKPYLLNSEKIPDRYRVNGDNYISTFKDKLLDKNYIIVVNQSCSGQNLNITSDYYGGAVKDLITNQTYQLGENILFSAGEGKMFEVVGRSTKPTPTLQTNIVQNASFEGSLNSWSSQDQISLDTSTYHTGKSSLKAGPQGSIATQNVNLQPGANYYFSYWIKAQNLNNNEVGMQVIQTTPLVTILTNVHWLQSGSYDWVKRVGFFKVPSDNTKTRIDISWINLSGNQNIWIDDVTLCRTDLPCADEYLIERLTTPHISYQTWFSNYNTTTNNGASSGDLNSDGKVNGQDYVLWLINSGNM